MGDLIKVGKGSLEGMAADIKSTHNNLKSGFEDLSGELLRTLPEWGEGTASRQSYDQFKKKVDNLFQRDVRRRGQDAAGRHPGRRRGAGHREQEQGDVGLTLAPHRGTDGSAPARHPGRGRPAHCVTLPGPT